MLLGQERVVVEPDLLVALQRPGPLMVHLVVRPEVDHVRDSEVLQLTKVGLGQFLEVVGPDEPLRLHSPGRCLNPTDITRIDQ